MTKFDFHNWLTNFVIEKQIDLSDYVDGKDCQLQVGDVISAFCNAPEVEQKIIKDTIVKIDFANGDILHYIKYMATALDKEHKIGM